MSSRRLGGTAWKLLALWAAAAVVLALVAVDGWRGRQQPIHVPSAPVIRGTGPSAAAQRASARASARAQVSAPARAATGDARLALLAAATLAGQPAGAAVAGKDLTTGAHVAWTSSGFGSDTPAYLASAAKLDVAEMVLLAKADARQTLSDDEDAQLDAMLTRSDNDAADRLYTKLGDDAARAELNRRLGLTSTTLDPQGRWGLTRSSPDDQLRLLSNLTDQGGPLSAAAKDYLGAHMSNVADDQDWGVGTAGQDAKLKNGWLPLSDAGDWVLTSVGVVTAPNGHRLQLVVLSNGWPSKDEGVPLVGELADALVQSLAG